jgi:prophage DNA circulation protein
VSWRKQVAEPARFRGAAFFIESVERGGGRRGVTHEFPARDDPFFEDLGRGAREFPVEGYVAGDDYLAARDALLTALEAAGPGELFHPYYGVRRVAVTGFRVRESAEDGGVARFSMEFVETPDALTQPAAVTDARAVVVATLARVDTAVDAEFLAAYDPGVYMDGPEDLLVTALSAVERVVKDAALGVQALADVRGRLADVLANLVELVNTPARLLADLRGLVLVAPPGILGVYHFDPGEPPVADTGNQQVERANFDVLDTLLRRLALLRAVELTIDAEYTSYEEAVDARDALLGPLDEQAESAGEDLYPLLVDLRADLVRAVPGADGDLPRLVAYTPAVTVPSLVLAHQLYGDVDSELDLVARNRVAVPGFVSAGAGLEVLSRD